VILDRLAHVDFRRPEPDRVAVEHAMRRYLGMVDHPGSTIRWFESPVKAYHHVFKLDDRELVDPARATSPEMSVFRRAHSDVLLAVSRIAEYSARMAAREAAWRVASRPMRERWENSRWGGNEQRMWDNVRARRDSGIDPIDGVVECAILSSLDHRQLDRRWISLIATWRHIVDAAQAGLFRYWITSAEIICVANPSLHVVDRRLHRENGPAVQWPSGERHWFWHGIEVPEWFIADFARVTPDTICNEKSVELRRCMIERFGAQRLVDEIGGQLAATDDHGKLWRCRIDGRETYAVVEVTNGTLEPDGGRRRYFLAVPPYVETPREAVAWTYGLESEEYELAVRT
jgi:hypothetical protein